MSLPIWIVVANGSRARLLQRKGPSQALVEVHNWVHPAARQHRDDLPQGHRQSGIQARSGLAPRQSIQDREREVFAREIMQWLSHELNNHAASSVALLSSNPFLGEMLAHQHQGQLHRQVCATHAIDLTSLPLQQLSQRLREDYRL